MGTPVNFKGANRVLVAPKGREECVSDMPVFNNGTITISCWELTVDEVAELLEVSRKTGCARIWISIMFGPTTPPVYVGTENSVRQVAADFGPLWKKE